MNAVISGVSGRRSIGPMVLAGVVTATLFLLMQALIAVEVPPLETSTRIRFDPIMPPRVEPEVRSVQTLQKPPEPLAAPEWQAPQTATENPDSSWTVADLGTPKIGIDRIDASAGISTIVPIFRIAPDYPASALRRGIQGHVDLLFDVSASGKTENIRVLDAQPPGVFEKAAVRTLGKWKYQPPNRDGVPYGQANMTTRISFRLET